MPDSDCLFLKKTHPKDGQSKEEDIHDFRPAWTQ